MKKTNSLKVILKKLAVLITVCSLFVFTLTACTSNNTETLESDFSVTREFAISDDDYASDFNSINLSTVFTYTAPDTTVLGTTQSASDTDIIFSESSILSKNSGATVSGNTVTVTKAGTYSLSGSSKNANIVVNAKGETVNLVLSGVDIISAQNSIIFVQNAEKVIVTSLADTCNILTDTADYTLDEDNEPTATVFSKSDLTINGTGTLAVCGNYNNAVQCKDTLKIIGANLQVNSVDDAVIGKDYVYVESSNINIDSEGDGIRATNDDTVCGNIIVKSGNFNIDAGTDAIQAYGIEISDGNFDIISGGGSTTISSDKGWGFWGSGTSSGDSAKGIKASDNIVISGGTFVIDSSDDAIHSNNNIKIEDGNFEIDSGDDGIHADATVLIEDGTINIYKSYEAIEGLNITINSGNIYLVASDDGINVAGGADSSSLDGRPGQNDFFHMMPGGGGGMDSDNGSMLEINGGNIYVSAQGDGLDSNGSVTMSGGTVIVSGPTDSGNGALDYNGSFIMSGGLLVASGSSGMAQAISSSSSVNCVKITFSSSQSGRVIHLQNSEGDTILNYTTVKSHNSLVFASSALNSGSYDIYTGGTIQGQNILGYYSNDAEYSSGMYIKSFTVNSINTSLNI